MIVIKPKGMQESTLPDHDLLLQDDAILLSF
jgi:hypothetical protein